MVFNIKYRLVAIAFGLSILILSFIMNAESWLILSAIHVLSFFFFICLPYFSYLYNIKNGYRLYILFIYLLFLLFLFLVKKSIFFCAFFLLPISFLSIKKYSKFENSSDVINEELSPFKYIIKKIRTSEVRIAIIFAFLVFLSYYLFTPLFTL